MTIKNWVAEQLGCAVDALQWQDLSGDASFRRYSRCRIGGKSWMVAVAPPEKENNEAFVAVAHLLDEAGVRVPKVLAVDYQHGFLLQSDLGDRLLLSLLNPDSVDDYYRASMQQIAAMQTIEQDHLQSLPAYDHDLLAQELGHFPAWFVDQMLGYQLTDAEQTMLQRFFDQLAQSAQQQPQVFVHRDYHSRNIMVTEHNELATIDFQDAVVGPLTYDLVSLLRDCYVVWPREQVQGWVRDFHRQYCQRHDVDLQQFQTWFDLMGLQRHIKVLGIFARLSIRDGKHGYLNDLPTVVRYVRSVAAEHHQAADFLAWFDDKLLPLIARQSWGEAL